MVYRFVTIVVTPDTLLLGVKPRIVIVISNILVTHDREFSQARTHTRLVLRHQDLLHVLYVVSKVTDDESAL